MYVKKVSFVDIIDNPIYSCIDQPICALCENSIFILFYFMTLKFIVYFSSFFMRHSVDNTCKVLLTDSKLSLIEERKVNLECSEKKVLFSFPPESITHDVRALISEC